jgi:hypothetical protein
MESPLPFRVQAHNSSVDLRRFATLQEALDAIVAARPRFPVTLETLNLATTRKGNPRYKVLATSIWKTQARVYEDLSWGHDPSEGPICGALTFDGQSIIWEIPPR